MLQVSTDERTERVVAAREIVVTVYLLRGNDTPLFNYAIYSICMRREAVALILQDLFACRLEQDESDKSDDIAWILQRDLA